MSGEELYTLLQEHGGLVRIHVVPANEPTQDHTEPAQAAGWQNVFVCRDGFRVRPTPEEHESLAAYLGERRSLDQEDTGADP